MKEKEHFITHFMSIVLKPKIDKSNIRKLMYLKILSTKLFSDIVANQIQKYMKNKIKHDK